MAPHIDSDYNALPSQEDERRSALVDWFGQHLFAMRASACARLERLLADKQARDSMGTIPSKPYHAVASQSREAQEAALGLAHEAIDGFLKNVLCLFQSMGTSLTVGADHAVRYRITMEIIRKDDEELREEFVVNRGNKKAFGDYFGRWLLRFNRLAQGKSQ